jgi:hypothetical protein
MTTAATLFAIASAYALAGVAIQHARLTKRTCDQRLAAAGRALAAEKSTADSLQNAVEQRDRVIAVLVARLSVGAVTARKPFALGLPRHRLDPRHINLN